MTPPLEDLFTVRFYRAFHDPVIYHGRSAGYEAFLPDWIDKSIHRARFERAQDVDLYEPITKATWPETAAHLGSATGDAGAINEKFVISYVHAIEKSAEIMGMDLEIPIDKPSPYSSHGENIGANVFIDDLRTDIQRSLNNRITDNYREQIAKSNVPTWAWKHQSMEKPNESTPPEQTTETTLSDFTTA